MKKPILITTHKINDICFNERRSDTQTMIEIENQDGVIVSLPKDVFETLSKQIEVNSLKADAIWVIKNYALDKYDEIVIAGCYYALNNFVEDNITPSHIFPTEGNRSNLHYEFARGRSIAYSMYKKKFKDIQGEIKLLGITPCENR